MKVSGYLLVNNLQIEHCSLVWPSPKESKPLMWGSLLGIAPAHNRQCLKTGEGINHGNQLY